MEKLYEEIEFKNDSAPDLNEGNLNAISHALNEIDNRVIEGYTAAVLASQKIGEIQQLVESASTSAENASNSASSAASSVTDSANYAMDSSNSALESKSYAVGDTGSREGENRDNAKYYKEKCAQIYASLGSAITPQGSINFADLPNFADIEVGYMYNILDDFTTDSRFIVGAGVEYKRGSNVYYIKDNNVDYWDVFAGSSSVAVDTELSTTSDNPIANKAVAIGLAEKAGHLQNEINQTNENVSENIEEIARLNAEIARLNTSLTDIQNQIKKGLPMKKFDYANRVFVPKSADYTVPKDGIFMARFGSTGGWNIKINNVSQLTSIGKSTASVGLAYDFYVSKGDVINHTIDPKSAVENAIYIPYIE